MRIYLCCLIILLAFSPLQGQLEIRFDYEMIEGLRTIQEKNTLTDADFKKLLAAKGTTGFLHKMQSYRPEADESGFKESLSQLLGATPDSDMFFYGRVTSKLKTGIAFVTNVKKEEPQIIEDLLARIGPFWPAGQPGEITVYFVFGAIGGGWTLANEPNAFYVDISSFGENDAIGFQYLCTHEILHLVQDRTRPQIDRTTPVPYFLEQAFREGMATYLADFTEIESAEGYALFNQKIYRKNERRIASNYQLFELLVTDLSEKRCTYDFADNLSLSGMYDSPAYFVFYDMIRALEARLGKAEVAKYFELGAIAFIQAYQRLQGTEHRFSERLEVVLQQLD